jgi:hypothetical protein
VSARRRFKTALEEMLDEMDAVTGFYLDKLTCEDCEWGDWRGTREGECKEQRKGGRCDDFVADVDAWFRCAERAEREIDAGEWKEVLPRGKDRVFVRDTGHRGQA